MHEQGHFTVDSTGEAEFQTSNASEPHHPIMRIGNNIVAPLGGEPLNAEQIGDAKYFVEPGGRIIDTETGEVVTHGDGSRTVHIQPIHDYEERNKKG